MSGHALGIALATVFGVTLVWTVDWLRRMRAAVPPVHPPFIEIAGENSPRTQATIPRIIWSHWHERPAPPFVERCWLNWQLHLSEHEIRIVERKRLTDWIAQDDLPAAFDTWPPYRQADWLRLKLLALYGGIWVDASTLFTRDLAWLHESQQQHQWEFAACYSARDTHHLTAPLLENWFFAATPGSGFARDLFDEFDVVMREGERQYLDRLQAEGHDEYTATVQGLGDPIYLVMFVCGARLMRQHPQRYRVGAWRAEDTGLAYQWRLNWKRRNLFIRLAWMAPSRPMPWFIKISSNDRARIVPYIDRQWIRRGSLLDLQLPALQSTPQEEQRLLSK